MLHLLVHLGVLLMEFLGIGLSRHDVLLHLFDFIIEHEFKLL
jgi:hypothetical protein